MESTVSIRTLAPFLAEYRQKNTSNPITENKINWRWSPVGSHSHVLSFSLQRFNHTFLICLIFASWEAKFVLEDFPTARHHVVTGNFEKHLIKIGINLLPLTNFVVFEPCNLWNNIMKMDLAWTEKADLWKKKVKNIYFKELYEKKNRCTNSNRQPDLVALYYY